MMETIGVILLFIVGWFVLYLVAVTFKMACLLLFGGVLKVIVVVIDQVYFCFTGKHTDLLKSPFKTTTKR